MTNLKLNYTRKGSINSEVILFIHPLGADNSVFDEIVSKLGKIAFTMSMFDFGRLQLISMK